MPIVEIPDKNMEIEFPDDMPDPDIERIIMTDVYGQDVLHQGQSPSLSSRMMDLGKKAWSFVTRTPQSTVGPVSIQDRQAFKPAAFPYQDLIESASAEFKFNPDFSRRMFGQESGFNTNEVSPAGAIGVGQLMPGTAKDLGVKNPYDPNENIRASLRYLRQLMDEFGNDSVAALIAYNWGPQRMRDLARGKLTAADIPEETRKHVDRILGEGTFEKFINAKGGYEDINADPDFSVGRLGGRIVESSKDVAKSLLHGVRAFYDAEARMRDMSGDGVWGAGGPDGRLGPLDMMSPEQIRRGSATLQDMAAAGFLKRDPEYNKSSGFIEDLVGMIPQQATNLVAAATPAGSIGVFANMALQIMGGQYDELVKEGVPEDRAFLASLLNASAQGWLEKIGFDKWMKIFTGKGSPLIGRVLQSMGTEYVTEFAQKFPESTTNIWAKNPDKTTVEQFRQFIEDLPQTIKEGHHEGLVAGTFAGITGGFGGKVKQYIENRTSNAKDDGDNGDTGAESPGPNPFKSAAESVDDFDEEMTREDRITQSAERVHPPGERLAAGQQQSIADGPRQGADAHIDWMNQVLDEMQKALDGKISAQEEILQSADSPGKKTKARMEKRRAEKARKSIDRVRQALTPTEQWSEQNALDRQGWSAAPGAFLGDDEDVVRRRIELESLAPGISNVNDNDPRPGEGEMANPSIPSVGANVETQPRPSRPEAPVHPVDSDSLKADTATGEKVETQTHDITLNTKHGPVDAVARKLDDNSHKDSGIVLTGAEYKDVKKAVKAAENMIGRMDEAHWNGFVQQHGLPERAKNTVTVDEPQTAGESPPIDLEEKKADATVPLPVTPNIAAETQEENVEQPKVEPVEPSNGKRVEDKIEVKADEIQTGKEEDKPIQEDKHVGKNSDGNEIFEDRDGNRYYTVDGVKSSAPRPIGPRGELRSPYPPAELFDRGKTEFLTAQEVSDLQPPQQATSADKQEEPAHDDKPQTTRTPGDAALEGSPAGDVSETEGVRATGRRGIGGGGTDESGSRPSGRAGIPPRSSMGDDEGEVHLPAGRRGGKRGATDKRLVPGDEGLPSRDGETGRGRRGGRSVETNGDVRSVSQTLPATEKPSAEPEPILLGDSVPSIDFHPSEDDFRITDDIKLGEGGQRTKYRNNIEAIRLLKQLQEQGRRATSEEQQVLAKYVGWGGIPQAFDADNEKWSKQYAELKEILTEDEYQAAKQSTQYAHYTSAPIIRNIYKALAHLGFTGGKILEPGCGVGNFVGLMPDTMRSSTRFTGIERERIAAGIAKHLYPNQNIQQQDFTAFKSQTNYFDAVVGNPPFGETTLTDVSGLKHLSGLSIHNYFAAKSVDLTRPNGVLAFVVTNYFMDAKRDQARKYISERTRFLGAIRLPNTSFTKNAGTEVTTDIIFLQKLHESEFGGKSSQDSARMWLDITTIPDPLGGENIPINRYFSDHPEMMLGRMERSGTMYAGGLPALSAIPGMDLQSAFDKAVSSLPENVFVHASVSNTKAMNESLVVALEKPPVQEYGFFTKDGNLYRRLPDEAGESRAEMITPETRWSEKQALGETRYRRILAMTDLRFALRELLSAESAGQSHEFIEGLRKTLNEKYDDFTAKYGLINERSNMSVFVDDPDFPLLSALEYGFNPGVSKQAAMRQGTKPEKASAQKAPILSRRVIAPREAITKAETPQDAVFISLAERGVIDVEFIGSLLGTDAKEVLEGLADGDDPILFLDPATRRYELRDAYLSGNVRKKLKVARAAAMSNNVRALEKVLPEDIQSHEISIRMGSPWVPTDIYESFVEEILGEGTRARIVYVPINGSFLVDISPGSTVHENLTYGTKDVGASTIIANLMNNKPTKVGKYDKDGKFHIDEELTDAATEKAMEIAEKFEDWAFKDADRSERLVRAYNDTINNYVKRTYDGSRLRLPGKVPDDVIRLRKSQMNAVARIVQDRTALLDHVVGAGKTYAVIAAAMELKRTGLAKKPMIVVPNHLVKQWAADFYRLYPGANILTATKKDFEKKNRRKFLAKIATGDWDAVIIAHSSFGFIRPSAEFETQFNRRQIAIVEEFLKSIEDNPNEGGKAFKRTVKQIERIKEQLEQRINALRDKKMDDLLDFGQLGVDQLFVDEAHHFKNLMFTTKMNNVRGLGDSKGSQRAYDMYVKVNQIFHQNGGNQGVVFATGTPVSNSLAEMYHMMRYLIPDIMADLGFEAFDSWANTFASVETVWMQSLSGDGYKASNRMKRFINTPELMRIYDQFADTITLEDLKQTYKDDNHGKEFPVPKVKGGKREPVSIASSDAQKKFMKSIIKRAKAIERRTGAAGKGADNMLAIIGDARKAAIDMRLIDPSIETRDPKGRIAMVARGIFDRYRQYRKVKGTQLVFSDLGTPKKQAQKELKEYEGLKERAKMLSDENLLAKAEIGDEDAIRILADAEAAMAKLESKGRDWLDGIQAAKRGFSIYDDLREALIELGIPDKEIAFIHDFNTDDQKAGLFRALNRGDVRVLIGSTEKMGAGTNVQERLVALHHVDVPWRPSDIEQREGRIVRQGNRLLSEIPNFEVEILNYVTKDTLDLFMWQMQENKLSMIAQLRERKMDREMDDVMEELILSAGEMQAAATSNPYLIEEIRLKDAIKKLERQKRLFDGQQNSIITQRKHAQRIIDTVPDEISRYEKVVSNAVKYKERIEKRLQNLKFEINGETFAGIRDARRELTRFIDQTDASGKKTQLNVDFNGEVYTARAKLSNAFAAIVGDQPYIEWKVGGNALIRYRDIFNAIENDVRSVMKSDQSRAIGSIAGFNVTIEGYEGERADRIIEVSLTANGETFQSEVEIHRTQEGNWPTIVGISDDIVSTARNIIRGIPSELEHLKESLAKAKRNLSELKDKDASAEWPGKADLAEARRRYSEVLKKLSNRANGEMSEESEEDQDYVAFSLAGGPAPIFYSQLRRVAEKKLPGSGLANSIRQILKSWAGKGEFKQEELDWSGVMEWLGERGGKVSKEEVLDFLRSNEIFVHEIEKRDGDDHENDTRFDRYQLPGGKDYRELLLVLPERTIEFDNSRNERAFEVFRRKMIEKYGGEDSIWKAMTDKEMERYEALESERHFGIASKSLQEKRRLEESANYKSPHWDEKNVVAHVRFNEHIDTDGKKVLFIEEVQSDWHQEGRVKGYNHGDNTASTPDAPFKTTWPLLAVKRMIRYAAENGFDRIAWTTGEQQAERYDLSKEVEEIAYWKDGDGTWGVSILGKDGNMLQGWDPNNFLTADELERQLGKEIAQKIINDDGDITPRTDGWNVSGGERFLSGDNLKVGGAGMKAFYDRILPFEVGKYVKKWGAKVSDTLVITNDAYTAEDFEGGVDQLIRDLLLEKNEAVKAHSIDITEAMRDSAMQGQPLFSKENVKAWPDGFPKVNAQTHPGKVIRHPDHAAAKAGDVVAAARLVRDLIKPEKILALKDAYPGAKLVFVHSEEESGRNKIPSQYAEAIHVLTGLDIDDDIVQINTTHHTGKGALPRLLSRAKFDGNVELGREYILVDDIVTQGGTLSELRHYIENNGGKVVSATSLGFSTGSNVLAIQAETVNALERKFGRDALEKILADHDIAGSLEALTNSEGKYLLSYKDVDRIRDSLAQARQEAGDGAWESLLSRSFQKDGAPEVGGGVTPSSSSVGMKSSELRSAVSEISDKWKNGPRIKIFQDAKDLPEHIKERAGKRGASIDSIEGVYDPETGSVYLVAGNISSAERAQQVLLHEAVGHFGVEVILGSARFDAFLNEVVASYGTDGLREIADRYGFDLETRQGRRQAAREKIAQMAERGERPGFLRRLYAAIRDALRKIGFTIKLSDGDILAMIERGRRYVEGGGNTALSFSPEWIDWPAAFSVIDWQEEANRRARRNKKTMKIIPVTAHITDQVPKGGHYRYKTNPNMTGNWIISGEMKVNRILTDDEVAAINSAAGYSDLPRQTDEEIGPAFSLKARAADEISSAIDSVREYIDMDNKEIGFTWKALRTPEYWEEPVGKAIFEASVEYREKRKHEIFTKTLNNYGGEKVNEIIKGLLHHGKGRFAKFRPLELYDRNAKHIPKAYRQMWSILDAMDIHEKRWDDYTDNRGNRVEGVRTQMTRKGVSGEVIHAIDAIRNGMDEALELMRQNAREILDAYKKAKISPPVLYTMKDDSGREKPYTLMDAYKEMGELKGSYMPRMWEPGDYEIYSTDKEGQVHRTTVDRGMGPMRYRPIYKAIRALEKRGHTVTTFDDGKKFRRIEKLPESILSDINMVEVSKLLEKAVGGVKREDLDPKMQQAFRMELIHQTAEILKGRAFRAHRISRKHRSGRVVRGYIEDPLARSMLYFSRVAGGIAKGESAIKMYDALMGKFEEYERDDESGQWVRFDEDMNVIDSRRMTQAEIESTQHRKFFEVGGLNKTADLDRFEAYKLYIHEQLRNPDAADRLIGFLKSLVTFKHLGFNPRTVAVNVTALATTAPPAIQEFAGGGKTSLSRVIVEITRAMKDYGSFMNGGKLRNKHEQDFFDELRGSAQLQQYTQDATQDLTSVYGKTWGSVMNASMYLFGKSEEYVRGATMLAAYRVARSRGASPDDARALAEKSSNRAHGVYHHGTLPLMAMVDNAAAKIVKMGYTYQKFTHNYLQFLHEINPATGRRKNTKAFAWAMFAPMVLFGLKSSLVGWVGYEIWRGIMRALGEGEEPEKELNGWLRKNIGESAETVSRYGVTGLAGIDVTGSTEFGFSVPKTLLDLAGPFGGVVVDMADAVHFAATGQVVKMAEEIAPNFAANISKAVREASSGVTTKYGRRLWNDDGAPYVPSAGETVKKVFGFRSAGRAKTEAHRYEARREEANFARRRNDIHERFRSYVANGMDDGEELQRIIDGIQKYNDDVASAGLSGIVPMLTKKSLKSQVKRMGAPTKKERRSIALYRDDDE